MKTVFSRYRDILVLVLRLQYIKLFGFSMWIIPEIWPLKLQNHLLIMKSTVLPVHLRMQPVPP